MMYFFLQVECGGVWWWWKYLELEHQVCYKDLAAGLKTGRNISSDKGSSFMTGSLAGVGILIS